MIAPFYQHGLLGEGTNILIALIIGIFFGFFLERGGLANATKLAGQFYFYDLTVFKMMFSAIVTAMVGLYLLSSFGFLDLSLVYLIPTYILPQIVGGFIFGIGFVMGGLCPGTSCVSLTTGRLDSIWLILGLTFGVFVFGITFPYLKDFFYSTPMGQLTFPKMLNISYGILVVAVILISIAGFLISEKIEAKFARKHSN